MSSVRVPARRRRTYLDWLRGIAVLLMIEAHLFDSWVYAGDRQTFLYRVAIAVGGMGTAFFLMLAGASAALSAGSKYRRSGDATAAAMAVAKHGAFIFLLAFVFRVQALVLGGSSSLADLLTVDILNTMGPSVVVTAFLWRLAPTTQGKAVVLATAAIVTSLATPMIRTLPLGFLPDPLEAYIIPVPGVSNFVFFPWMGLAFAGGVIGVLIDAAHEPERERRLIVAMGTAGALVVAVALGASYLPSPFPGSSFWTSSPSYFFIRAGLVTLGVALAYAWSASRNRPDRWSPILQLGQTSLFIYWIHVEMVYGLISKPLHQALTLRQAAVGYVLFSTLMLICAVGKERVRAIYSGSGGETLHDGRRITS